LVPAVDFVVALVVLVVDVVAEGVVVVVLATGFCEVLVWPDVDVFVLCVLDEVV
jgi:hypothetical protein